MDYMHQGYMLGTAKVPCVSVHSSASLACKNSTRHPVVPHVHPSPGLTGQQQPPAHAPGAAAGEPVTNHWA
jgi:hypothetical protein